VCELQFVHKLRGEIRELCEIEKQISEFGIVKCREMGGIDRSVV
jgi:hypothetical protein